MLNPNDEQSADVEARELRGILPLRELRVGGIDDIEEP